MDLFSLSSETTNSRKLVIGGYLIIFNYILGIIAIPVFVLEYYLGALIYGISWMLLIGGVALCGKQGWALAKEIGKKFRKSITVKKHRCAG